MILTGEHMVGFIVCVSHRMAADVCLPLTRREGTAAGCPQPPTWKICLMSSSAQLPNVIHKPSLYPQSGVHALQIYLFIIIGDAH